MSVIEDVDVLIDETIKNCTPPALIKAANATIPSTSRMRYERTYNEFLKWRSENNATSYSERILMAYFVAMSKKSKPTTLWAYYSMLKSILSLRHKVDISTYSQLTTFLKRQSDGYHPTKAKVFTEEEIKEFVFGASDREWLVIKVVCIFGLCGACRTEEFVHLCMKHIKKYPDMLYVQLDSTKTKNSRSFTVTGEFFDIVKKYMNLRPPKILTSRFFINYRDGKCTNQVIGKKKFSKMPRIIARYLNLPEPNQYIGHAFRRTSATIRTNTGANMETIQRLGGWKSSTVAEQYIDDPLDCKKQTNNAMPSSEDSRADGVSFAMESKNKDQVVEEIFLNTSVNVRSDVLEACEMNNIMEISETKVDTLRGPPTFNINNCDHVTIQMESKNKDKVSEEIFLNTSEACEMNKIMEISETKN